MDGGVNSGDQNSTFLSGDRRFMTSTDQTIDLQREELEIRDLQNVIAALRKELEDQHLEAKARVRETLTTAEGEQRQLRKTAAALRDEMERHAL